MKKFFLPILILLTTLMFSSCIIIGDLEESFDAKVKIRNYDNDYAYITEVRYQSVKNSDHISGTKCLSTYSTYGDVMEFTMPSGTYYIQVYGKYKNTQEPFILTSRKSIYFSSYSTNILTYDGHDIYKSY